MLLFKYTVRDNKGNLISDSRQAQDRATLINELRKLGQFPISIEEAVLGEAKPSLFNFRLSTRHITHITHQLANLLASGVMLSKALELLVKQTRDIRLQESLISIRDEISSGGHFWKALSKYPHLFSRTYISMVKAGETSGNLEGAITYLADFLEQKQQAKSEAMGVLMYPCILLLVGLGTIIFLMSYVVPKLLFILHDMSGTLPLATKLLLALSMFFSHYWWLLLIIIGLTFYLSKIALKQADVRLGFDKWFYTLPILGRIQQQAVFSHFAHLLGLLLSNGVSMVEALEVASEFTHNSYVSGRLQQVRKSVSEGLSVSASLEKTEVFSPVMIEAIAVGEETATLEQGLLKTAALYEREVKQELKRILGLLEPAIIFFMALAVGFLVMAILLPIFDMNFEII